MRSGNLIAEKSMEFAVRIVRLYKYLQEDKKEYILSKQVLRSGTSIGANIREAVEGYSKDDFTAKMSIALKEASETAYWLELMCRTGYVTEKQYKDMDADCMELFKLLTAIIKTSRGA